MGPAHLGPGPIWAQPVRAWAHLGPIGPIWARPIWAWAHLARPIWAPAHLGPGPIWARPKLGHVFCGEAHPQAIASNLRSYTKLVVGALTWHIMGTFYVICITLLRSVEVNNGFN